MKEKPQRTVAGKEHSWHREVQRRQRPKAGVPDVFGKQQGGQHGCSEPKGRSGQGQGSVPCAQGEDPFSI